MIESVNLHYENLPELNGEAERLMRRAFHEFYYYRRYLERARRWMWAPERIEKVAWEIAPSGSGPKPSPGIFQSTGNSESAWIVLKEPENDGEKDIVESFCDAEFVVEEPSPYASKIRVLDADPNVGTLLLERVPKGEEHLLFLPPNDYALKQQNRSLQRLQDSPDPEHRGLLRLVENSEWVQWPTVEQPGRIRWEFLTDPAVPGTDEQRKFVEIALGTPDFAILEGPPGSGKTTSICELIIQELRRGHRVMLCASTHVAVDNVLESLQDHGSTDTEVIAVRIGDKSRLSDEVKRFQLQERANTERADLIGKLSKLSNPSKSQKHLLGALHSSGESLIIRLILESANLVCGTTLGILQHPDIKNPSKERGAVKYDCLILDEASKTTFQEFLVPAMFAKRWVLVGDVRQLSPYIETKDVEANIRAIVPEEQAKICTDIFRCWKRLQITTQGLFVVNSQHSQEYVHQAGSLGLNVLDLSKDDNVPNALEFLTSHVIVAKEEIFRFRRLIPPDLEVISEDPAQQSQLKRRHDYWKEHFLRSKEAGGETDKEPKWANEIAWRLNRIFELRNDTASADRYSQEIEALLPHWYVPDELSDIARDLEVIERVSLPSILQLLQDGFRRQVGSHTGSSLTDGIRPESFHARHVKLSYQHRMHPEISRFPREAIYESGSLKDPGDMARYREWSYNRYPARAGWMHVLGTHGDASHPNLSEIETVIAELKAFLQWAAKNPKREGVRTRRPWTIAVLTFYRRQESELRRHLRWMFNQPHARTNFSPRDESAKVRLCTVDRFQGHESDVVFLSFVRARGVGFLDSPFRLNVALTRARYQLVLVGHQIMFANQSRSHLLQELSKLPRFGISLGSSRSQ